MKIEKIRDQWYRATLSVKGKKLTMFGYSRDEAHGKVNSFLRQTGMKEDGCQESQAVRVAG